MNILFRMHLLLLIAASTVLLYSCASKTVVESDLGISGAPDWVNEGTNILNNQKGRLFHGLGQAPSLGDESLQISTADNRARAKLAGILSTYLDAVSNDYLSASGSGKDAATEKTVSQQIRTLSKINLTGARIIAHWRDKKTRHIYSLAELDMDQVNSTLSSVKNMNEDLRRYIQDHGTNIFDKVSRKQ